MSTEAAFKNRDRFIELGIAISVLRKMRGMSQEELAARAGMSRSHLSAIEAPNIARAFSLEALFNLADALAVGPKDLIEAKIFPDAVDAQSLRIESQPCSAANINSARPPRT